MGRILILNLIAGCVLLLAACNKDMTEFNRQQIVGKWVSVDKEVMGGYRFSADGSCEKDIGFFEYLDGAPYTFDRPELIEYEDETEFALPLNHTIRYYRSNSSYTIRGDSLFIVDPALKGWSRRQIRFLTADTLVMSGCNSSTPIYYVRENPVAINPEPLFDYIFIYYPPIVFFSEQYYLLSRNGRYVNYNKIAWLLEGAIRKEDYEKLEHLYQQADILDYLEAFPYEDLFSLTEAGIDIFPSSSEHNLLFALKTLHVQNKDEPSIVLIRNNRLYKLSNDLSKIPAKDVKNYYKAYVSTLFYPDNLYFRPDDY